MSRWRLAAMLIASSVATAALIWTLWPASADSPATGTHSHASPAASPTKLEIDPAAPPTTEATLFERTEARLLAVQSADGSAAALTQLDLLTTREPEVNRFCHAIAHALGHRALEMADGNAAMALRDRDDVCGGGYTHGIIEMALGNAKDPKRDMLAICAPDQDGSCWHGIGHGLMFATGMDADASTRLCDRAPTGLLAARCGEGVYMQLFSADLGAHHTGGDSEIARDPSLAQDQCRSTRSPYSANCWFYASVVWLTAHPEAFSEGLTWCSTAGNDFAAQACAKGIGSRSVKFHPDDLSIGSTACSRAGRLLDSCVRGMASYWSVHWKGEVPPSDLCQHLHGRIKSRCSAVT